MSSEPGLQVDGRSDGNSLLVGFHWHSTLWGEVTLAELTGRCDRGHWKLEGRI
ncbi:MAG: hypothetical protein HC849_27605 [Oscillatoriales cyanobacterium RU_3_3]|nr:hypothetical protein [Microcoleus sp. SU_5_6]NJM63096.1 hypothetical protein [Oscillatoriales cyanobacterium RU_3_3]NJR25406.1 hypothetical protein [Richelia sp. CSU_2_1]